MRFAGFGWSSSVFENLHEFFGESSTGIWERYEFYLKFMLQLSGNLICVMPVSFFVREVFSPCSSHWGIGQGHGSRADVHLFDLISSGRMDFISSSNSLFPSSFQIKMAKPVGETSTSFSSSSTEKIEQEVALEEWVSSEALGAFSVFSCGCLAYASLGRRRGRSYHGQKRLDYVCS